MAELPGWDRARLAYAAPADVGAARWVVFARALEPTVTEPIGAQIALAEIEVSAKNARAREAAVKKLNRKHLDDLYRARDRQRQVRTLLMLDEPDEPEPVDEDEA